MSISEEINFLTYLVTFAHERIVVSLIYRGWMKKIFPKIKCIRMSNKCIFRRKYIIIIINHATKKIAIMKLNCNIVYWKRPMMPPLLGTAKNGALRSVKILLRPTSLAFISYYPFFALVDLRRCRSVFLQTRPHPLPTHQLPSSAPFLSPSLT